MSEIEQALKLDPLSVSMNFSEGWRMYMARDFQGAARQLRDAIEMDPSFALAHLVLGQNYAQMREYSPGIGRIAKGRSTVSNSAPRWLPWRASRRCRGIRQVHAHAWTSYRRKGRDSMSLRFISQKCTLPSGVLQRR